MKNRCFYRISDPAVKDSLVNEVQTLHESKAKFDQKASQWLERANVDASKVASILSVSRSLRSKTRSNVSCSSSVLKARAVTKEEVARLRLVQLQEKQSLLEAEAAFKRLPVPLLETNCRISSRSYRFSEMS